MSIWCRKCGKTTFNQKVCDHCGKYPKDGDIKSEHFIITFIKSFFEKIDTTKQEPKQSSNIKTSSTKKETLLTATQIGKDFEVSARVVNQVLFELKWIEKQGKWIVPTAEGLNHGAESTYDVKTKLKYVRWNQKVLNDIKLIVALEERKEATTTKEPKQKTSWQEKIKKGQDYEEYITKVYKSRGYHVTEYGKEMGKKDHGIDLIAKKEKEIVLIQCKNWNESGKWKITHKDIKAFQTDARTFVEDKPLLRGCTLTARYTLSGDFIHQSAIKHIEEMQKLNKNIDYEIVKTTT